MLKKGNKKTIRAWAMYDWANSAYSLTITSAIFPGFYEAVTSRKNETGEVIQDFILDKYGIVNTSMYSYAISAGFLVTALLAPILSGIADYSDSKKRFMQFFCYLGAAACAGLYFFDLDHFWLGIILTTVACIGFSGGNIFYNAYLPEIAEPKDHDRISALGFSLGYVGSVLLLLFNLSMMLFPDLYFDVQGQAASFMTDDASLTSEQAASLAGSYFEGKACQISFLSVGIWWFLFSQITFAALPNKTFNARITNSIIWNGYREIKKVFLELKETVRLKRFLIAYFLYNTAVQTVMYMAANFAAKEIKSKDANGNDVPFEMENLIYTILIIQIVAIGGAYLFSYLSSKLGNLRALSVAVIAWVIIVAFAYYVQYEYAFYSLAAAVGMVMGGVQALSRSTYAKFLPETKDHASYFSFYNMCYYVGTVVGTFLFGYILTVSGNIRLCILSIGSFFLLGLIVLLTVPKEERWKQMQ